MAAGQKQAATDPGVITIGTVRRILELGEMLASVLTPDEIEEIQKAYDLKKSIKPSRNSNIGNIIDT